MDISIKIALSTPVIGYNTTSRGFHQSVQKYSIQSLTNIAFKICLEANGVTIIVKFIKKLSFTTDRHKYRYI